MHLRSTSVVFCAIDNLIGLTSKALIGFPEFVEGLAEAEIPLVPVTGRGRLQIDNTLRKFDLGHPFIAEGGCGAYLPEDYFHLKPPRSLRLGRFTCIPHAAPQPAAAEILDTLSEETGIEVAALRGLSPRELSQNVGLPQREAELLRQRDFDELFLFCRGFRRRHREISGPGCQTQGAGAQGWRVLVAGLWSKFGWMREGPWPAIPAVVSGESREDRHCDSGGSCRNSSLPAIDPYCSRGAAAALRSHPRRVRAYRFLRRRRGQQRWKP